MVVNDEIANRKKTVEYVQLRKNLFKYLTTLERVVAIQYEVVPESKPKLHGFFSIGRTIIGYFQNISRPEDLDYKALLDLRSEFGSVYNKYRGLDTLELSDFVTGVVQALDEFVIFAATDSNQDTVEIDKIVNLHNKRTELTVGFINTSAAGLFAGGVILPVIALSFPLTSAPQSGQLTLLTILVWGSVSMGIHWWARTMLEGLR